MRGPDIRFRVAATAIVVAAAMLRFWGLGLGLPHLMARPDDEAVLILTRGPAMGRFDLGWVVYPSAWVYLNWAVGEVVLRLGAWLGVWPAASFADVLAREPERLLLIGRALTATLGTAAVAATIAVGRAAFGGAAGLAAGALLAVNFLHARDAHSMKPDVAMSLGIIATLGACLALERKATPARGALAGLALGATAACKYPGVLLGAPVWLASWLGAPVRGWRRVVAPPVLVAAAVAAAVFVATSPFLVTPHGLGQLYTMVITPVFGRSASWGSTTLVQTSNRAPSFWYHLTVSLPVAMGWAGAVVVLAALAWAAITRPPLGWPASCFVLVWTAVVGWSPIHLARYLTPVTPVLALLSAGALAAAARAVSSRHAGVLLGVVTTVLALEPLAATVAHDRLAARTDTRVLATRWLAEHTAPGSRVAIVGTVFWGWGQPDMPRGVTGVFVPRLDAAALDATRATFLLAHDHVLFSSQVDEAALAALAPRLQLLAEFDPFVGPREAARFEAEDAYYLPLRGFSALSRPGPRVRIWAVRPAPAG